MGLLRCLFVGLVAATLLPGSFSGSRSHNLQFLFTTIWELDQELPHFSALGVVDGVIGGHYDSQIRRVEIRVPLLRQLEPNFWQWYTKRAQDAELRFISDVENLQKQFNWSGGVHTWQSVYDCEWNEDGARTRGYAQYGYDGKDFLSFNKETLTWTAIDPRAQITKRQWESDLDRSRSIKAYLEDECVEWLQKFLQYGKQILLIKERPMVKVARMRGYDGLETLVCWVLGFYPREIDATWRRDGEVWEQDTFRGGVLPNSDRSYHTWLRIEVDPTERARYRCHVEHAGLAEPLDLAWEEPAADTIPVPLIVGGGILAVVVLLVFLVLVYISPPPPTSSRRKPA